MSKNYSRWVTQHKDLMKHLWGLTSSDVCFTRMNRPIFHDAYATWIALVSDLSTNFLIDDNYSAIEHVYTNGSQSLKIMKELLLRLRDFVSCTERKGYRSFKRSLLHNLEDVGPLLTIIEECLRAFYLHPSGPTFATMNHILSFMGKLTFDDPKLETEAIKKFIATDEISVTASDAEIKHVNAIIRRWVDDFQPNIQFGLHGNGATSDVRRQDASSDVKSPFVHSNDFLNYVGFPAPEWATENPAYNEFARVQFVPKSFDAKRTICCESTTNMFWQKPVQLLLYRYIENSSLRKHIWFSNQEPSRRMAQLGSKYNSYYTIDLSAASDTVSWDLVRKVFAGTALLKYLWATRTRIYHLDGNEFVPAKFAPMGSALCFPVQSLLFAAICESTSVVKSPRYRVYGDDIVAHPRDISYTEVCEKLVRFGFTVNVTKSYALGPFREACGGEYYEGYDATPIRLSRGFQGTHNVTSAQIVALTPLCNNLLHAGCRNTRAVILRSFIKQDLLKYMEFTLEGDRGTLASFHASNFQLSTRTHLVENPRKPQYLRREKLGLVSRVSKWTPPTSDISESYRYYQWQAKRFYGINDLTENIERSTRPKQSLTIGWTPMSDSYGYKGHRRSTM